MRLTTTRLAAFAATFALLLSSAQAAQIVHFWDFESGFSDIVGNGGGTAGADVSTGVGQNGGTAAVFPGSVSGGGAYTSAGYVDTTGVTMSGPFAFTYWFNISVASSDPRGLFDFSSDAPLTTAGADGPQSLLNSSGANLVFRLDGEGAPASVAQYNNGGAGFVDGRWHFVAVNYDPTNGIEMHVDGFGIDATAAGAGNANWEVDQYLGAFNVNNQVSRGLNGSLDDVAIYSGNLSPAQIQGLYDGSLQPTQVPEPTSLFCLALGTMFALVAGRYRAS